MRLERFYTLIGLFVGGAFILTLFTSIFVYNTYSQNKSNSYVMFFNGSLKGLDTSSMVTYRGVKIGLVQLIELTTNKTKEHINIPVYVQFFVEKTLLGEEHPIQLLIKQGFEAKINTPNFLTGVASISIVKSRAPRKIENKTYNGYHVFPTRERVKKYLTIDATLKVAKQTFEDISAFVKSEQLRDAVDETRVMLKNFDRFAINLDEEIPSFVETFSQTLISISGAADSMQNLADYISRNPESLLRGK